MPPASANAESLAYGRLTIDTAALASNWRTCGARAPRAECAAVVKANAYGIGIENAVPALAEAGCRTFFVAQVAEAVAVRRLDAEAVIYVLNGLLPGSGDDHAAHELRPVLGSLDEIREWSAFCAATGWQGGAALHVDTGMSRLGLRMEEAAALAAEGSSFAPSLLMSHFACADTAGHALNGRQVAAFNTVRGLFPGVRASLCNSSGLFLPGDFGFDLVRPGFALYGGNPVPGKPNPMVSVITLEGRVLAIRTVSPGESVGYGATWMTSARPAGDHRRRLRRRLFARRFLVRRLRQRDRLYRRPLLRCRRPYFDGHVRGRHHRPARRNTPSGGLDRTRRRASPDRRGGAPGRHGRL